MSEPLYNHAILRLAANIPLTARLPAPDASAQRVSPICGSRVTADVVLDGEGRVADYGQEVRACALGQASAAILGAGVIGRDGVELADAADALALWLRGQGELPAGWADLALFEPARAHKGRHGSILLPWQVAAAVVESAARAKAA
ncbi:iron-sulfur cluster assembly scaffold protein [Sandaracinobacteroides saxicola]|uniref:Iron-sulfur cluster assembly scaffold protein n=1 Tax=Sandaracinobacteroides saxicola TaxID=2759707 RepID=A0A7G5IE96_9SPHN|nr:iron-sulfur cluster assembly scaffold protein [Sandaracinobacteroides saxicola]QMW21688.1 iron-sulfur cluster assembly scaffold protein [Sandaracinobacteroides saxicola]